MREFTFSDAPSTFLCFPPTWFATTFNSWTEAVYVKLSLPSSLATQAMHMLGNNPMQFVHSLGWPVVITRPWPPMQAHILRSFIFSYLSHLACLVDLLVRVENLFQSYFWEELKTRFNPTQCQDQVQILSLSPTTPLASFFLPPLSFLSSHFFIFIGVVSSPVRQKSVEIYWTSPNLPEPLALMVTCTQHK